MFVLYFLLLESFADVQKGMNILEQIPTNVKILAHCNMFSIRQP